MMIFHNRRKLQKEMEVIEGASKDHLGLLLEFLKNEWPAANQSLDEVENNTIKEIGYNELWLSYPPGTIVYSLEDEEWRAYRVTRITNFTRCSSTSFSAMRVECVFSQFDGTRLELAEATTSFHLSLYTGRQPIRN